MAAKMYMTFQNILDTSQDQELSTTRETNKNCKENKTKQKSTHLLLQIGYNELAGADNTPT